jgi:hypothetical protein
MIGVRRVAIRMLKIIWNHILEIIMHIIYRQKMVRSLIEVILSSLRILNMDSLNHRIPSFLVSLKEMMTSIRLIHCKHRLTFKIRVIKKMISKIIRQILEMGMIKVRQEMMMILCLCFRRKFHWLLHESLMQLKFWMMEFYWNKIMKCWLSLWNKLI